MRKLKKSSQSLVSEIVGSEKEIKRLIVARDKLESKIDEVKQFYSDFRKEYERNLTVLYFVNGRVSVEEYKLAKKVLDKAKEKILEHKEAINRLESLMSEINSILSRLSNSEHSEFQIKIVEKYLSTNLEDSSISENFTYEIKDLNRESKRLAHTVDALIDLKLGSF